MKKQTATYKKWIGGVVTSGLLLIANLFPLAVHAAGASIYLTTSSSRVSPGSSFIVGVYMNGGGNAVNAVEADLSFSASKLQYVGVNYGGSAFEITAPSGGSAGGVSIARGTTSTVKGGGLIATVTFRALGSSGSTSISIAGSSALSSDGNAVPFSTSGTAVTFAAYAAPVASSHSSSSSTSSAASTPAAPAPPKDTTPPVVSDIKLTNVTPFTATVTWKTNEASDSAVDYGLDNTYGLSASSAGKTTAHSVALSSSFLTPLATLHYHVKSADAAGNVATSPDQTLQLPGVPVTVTVYGSNGKPQAGASVSLDSQTATTNAQGTATLQSGLGNKQLVTSYNGVTVKKTVTVAKTTKLLTNYQLDLNRQPLNRWMLTTFSLLVLLLVLVGFDAYLFRSRIFSTLLLKLHYWHQTRPTPAYAGHKATPAVEPIHDIKPPSNPATEQPEPVNAAPVTAAQPEATSIIDRERAHYVANSTPQVAPVPGVAKSPEVATPAAPAIKLKAKPVHHRKTSIKVI